MDSRPNSLPELPKDIIDTIAIYSDPESIINWAASSKKFQLFFTQNNRLKLSRDLINLFFTLVVLALPKLSVANANKCIVIYELENLLKLWPELLTYRRTVKDHKGRILVDRTGYQIFLAYAADNLYPMLEKHFLRLPNGEAEMKKQFKEQFPHGIIKAYPKYDVEKARTALREAKELIQRDTLIYYKDGIDFRFLEEMSDATRKAIDDFFSLIQSDNKYTIGLVNDMKLYHEAEDIYYNPEEFNKFKGCPQRDAYSVFMLGGLQALFTPNLLQVLLQGANHVIVLGEPLVYVTQNRFYGVDVSPFDFLSPFRLGEHFYIDYVGTCTYSAVWDGNRAVFKEFCLANITSLEQQMKRFESADKPSKPVKWCSIL